MRHWKMLSILSLVAVTSAAAGPRSPTVVAVAMVRDATGATYFAPSNITAQPGDTLRFIVTAGMHDVDFAADSNPAGVRLPAATALIEHPGEAVNVVVALPPGTYYFQCDPHVMRGMTGHLTVEAPGR
ncbi:MAG TPA: plastocyanin/azurin family copper-binding protein [Gemmatimonadales bacterium]|nr:plastocyanin/azurin family copper-binding protein [Gemmatimonadales bacterium]